MMPKKKIAKDSYATLLNKVRQTLIQGQQRIAQERVRTYLDAGRIIHADLLQHKARADYGTEVLSRLANDLGVHVRLLQRCVQFARIYSRSPIAARGPQFSWSHYRKLISVSDDRQRARLEKEIQKNNWNVEQLVDHIKESRPAARASKHLAISVKPLAAPARGRLDTCRVGPANKVLSGRGPLVLDMGFRVEAPLPVNVPRVKAGNILEVTFKNGAPDSGRKATATADELFTYRAGVEDVIDGDTLLVSLDFRLGSSLNQKVRLRGINCPEMKTSPGRRAKGFVEKALQDCPFVIVKTYKDRTDRYDRYLADVFYLPKEKDMARVAAEGRYLNQDLLDAGLARLY